MVKLEFNDKVDNNTIKLKKNKMDPFQILDVYQSININSLNDFNWKNLLIWGENKSIMNSLLTQFENQISLIVIDPPFATGGDFNLKIQIGEDGKAFNITSYSDKWKDGLSSYLNFLKERIVLMKKLLKSNGSIYIHLDWHSSHHVKLMMDEIFGSSNFLNDLIWAYPAASAKTRRFFIRSYDNILFYSKSDDYVFNDDTNIYMEYSNRVKNALKKDEQGVFYYRGGSHDGKKLSRKVYVKKKGIFPRDVWNDIPYIRANTNEYQGFSTQKPERLLKRIILASTNENDIVADFFCGSGTTLAVSEKLGRRWIGSDINMQAIHISRKRILNINFSNDLLNWKKKYGKKPLAFQILGLQTEKEDWQKKVKLILHNHLKETTHLKESHQIQDPPELRVKIHQNNNIVKIELVDYINTYSRIISEDLEKKISSFSDWIDYWAIDYEFRDQKFNNNWISFRTPKMRKIKLISDHYLYGKAGTYHLCVKVIDIFGIETHKSVEIII
ncbi:hypothetical protein LCGC14_0290750 [marine sediment metagenome]|uniref:DNA methylase N-4/N-6 domain-containing protein n=1 Tax=marine sediment metagenome TaxID=412755 RepID=A0A0F9WEJ0_9ZZZZ